MVLSNKKLKEKLRAELTESLTKSVAGSNPINDYTTSPDPDMQNQNSLRKLLDSATQKRPRLSKREKRRKVVSLQGPEAVEKGDDSDSMEGDKEDDETKEGGSKGLGEKKSKKRKRKLENGNLDAEGNGVVKDVKKSKKKKKLKKKGKSEQEKGADLEGEKQGVLESNKNINSQENENDPTKVYVGGIPYYSTEDDIRSYFESCGTITEIDCMRFPESGKFRGIAIISFKTEAAAKRALALDGADMGGLFLKIQPYKTTRSSKTTNFAPKVVDGYNRIYVGNLSWDVTEDELRKLFSGCNISSIRFGMDKGTGEFRGYAHVDFSDSLSLTMALKLDQKIVCGRPVRISCAVPLKKAGTNAISVPKSKEAVPTSREAVHTTREALPTTREAAPTTKEAVPTTKETVITSKETVITNKEASNTEQSSNAGKMKRRTCYECGEKGHISSACPKKQPADPTISSGS